MMLVKIHGSFGTVKVTCEKQDRDTLNVEVQCDQTDSVAEISLDAEAAETLGRHIVAWAKRRRRGMAGVGKETA